MQNIKMVLRRALIVILANELKFDTLVRINKRQLWNF